MCNVRVTILQRSYNGHVTVNVHDRYMAVTWPLHDRYTTVTSPLHVRYMSP
eukprot:COSAG05_NODE_1517_length_4653_cov_48.023496_4_plen_51_part_00